MNGTHGMHRARIIRITKKKKTMKQRNQANNAAATKTETPGHEFTFTLNACMLQVDVCVRMRLCMRMPRKCIRNRHWQTLWLQQTGAKANICCCLWLCRHLSGAPHYILQCALRCSWRVVFNSCVLLFSLSSCCCCCCVVSHSYFFLSHIIFFCISFAFA